MRKPIIIGNWKMNTTSEQGVALAQSICRNAQTNQNVDIVLCPPFTSIPLIHTVIQNTPIKLGAQNLNENPNGAYTGEISAPMIAEFAEYVIVGHSERRSIYGETNEQVTAKVNAAYNANLTPIVCIGEDAEEREQGRAERFVKQQLRNSIGNPQNLRNKQTIIAYEPVWAIGTGNAATIEQIKYMTEAIREEVARMDTAETAAQTRIIYGGSTNPNNIHQIAQSKPIDGVLVGSASLNNNDFIAMIQSLTQHTENPLHQ